jgi:hypothetical protein
MANHDDNDPFIRDLREASDALKRLSVSYSSCKEVPLSQIAQPRPLFMLMFKLGIMTRWACDGAVNLSRYIRHHLATKGGLHASKAADMSSKSPRSFHH